MDKKIIVEFYNYKQKSCVDLELPVNITAVELFNGIQSIYGTTDKKESMSMGYLKSENPIALLKGNKTLEEFGLHDGSIIIYQ